MTRKRPHHGSRRRAPRSGPRKPHALIEGTLRVTRPGVAHVDTAEGTFAVARRGIREGMNGDTVQVSLIPMHGRGGERVAYVQTVVVRASSAFVGTFGVADPLGVVSPLDGRIAHDFFVLPEDDCARRLGVHAGDVVVARILAYPERHAAGVATIDRRLGSATELDISVESVIASHGLATVFPEEALREAREVRVDVEGELAADGRRIDLRGEPCLTVDPADARDFDDAVWATRTEDGGYELSVHIADVTQYVRWDSAMDREARRRTCSVYLVDRVLPMLPEELCCDACSLRPHEDRLAMTVRVRLDAGGHVRDAEAFPSAIRSRSRLSYDEVDRLLDGARDAHDLPCADQDRACVCEALGLLDEIAQLRREVRRARGSVDFATSEAKVMLDARGHPVGISVRRRTRATSLIEEAMLLANEGVAKMLSDHGVQTAYRVHERPSPEDLAACLPALRELGLVDSQLSERLVAGDPHAISEVLEAAEGTQGAYVANALLLRAQKRAIYLPRNDGHYALGASAYCHFTSPIRRYPDVLVHRALKHLLAGLSASRERSETERALPRLCRTCSDLERVADVAARDSQHVKMAEFYAERVGERFSGVVVGCERFGLFVMLDDTCAEGFVPVRALGDEWYSYSEEHLRLTGESTGRVWRLGQRIAVEVAGTDVARGRIDFVLAGRMACADG